MSHPFRHDLEAALARIDQLESALADSRRPMSLGSMGSLVWARVRGPLMVGTVFGSLLGGVAFSSLVVSGLDDDAEETSFDMASDIAELHGDIASVRTQIVTVSPRGVSALQVGDIASGKAAALNTACGAVNETVAVVLDLDITADGSVSRAQARGPDVLARCTERTAKTWTFPASDGATHATVPFYFRPSIATGARPVRVGRGASGAAFEDMGSLAVICTPTCDTVLLDGEPLGRSPILAHPAAVGRHQLKLISGTEWRQVATDVHPHQLAEIRVELTERPEADPLGPPEPRPMAPL